MSLGLCFWILFLLAVVLGFPPVREKAPSWAGSLILALMLLCLGWAVFGAPVQA
jgi:hypothetical protein